MLDLPCRLAVRFADVQSGDWFVPVSINAEDQHYRIPDAIDMGAVGVIYEEGKYDPSLLTVPSLVVPNLRDFLFSLAQECRSKLLAKIAVVAGSNGKSTVKEMVGSILKIDSPHTFFSHENWNTKTHIAAQIIGLPLECQRAVFEVGARRAGDFSLPLQMLQPDVVCLLNIGSAHLGEFGSRESLRETKLSILDSPSAHVLVVPKDQEIFPKAQEKGKKIISFSAEAGVVADICVTQKDDGKFALYLEGKSIDLLCPWNGPNVCENMAAAAAIAFSLGLSMEQIAAGLDAFKGLRGRFEILPNLSSQHKRLVVNDAFNSSPESLCAGLKQFAKIRHKGEAIFVLGPMLELGEESDVWHRSLGHKLPAYQKESDWLVTIGEAKSLGEAAVKSGWKLWAHCNTIGEVQEVLSHRSWDSLYMKGSKASGLFALAASVRESGAL